MFCEAKTHIVLMECSVCVNLLRGYGAKDKVPRGSRSNKTIITFANIWRGVEGLESNPTYKL